MLFLDKVNGLANGLVPPVRVQLSAEGPVCKTMLMGVKFGAVQFKEISPATPIVKLGLLQLT
jgi:hypothetical protein